MFPKAYRLTVVTLTVLCGSSLALTGGVQADGQGHKKLFTNSIGMKFVLIPAGDFDMGSAKSPEEEAGFFNKAFGSEALKTDSFGDEHPQHLVKITRPFYLGVFAATRGQFRKFVNDAGYKTHIEKARLRPNLTDEAALSDALTNRIVSNPESKPRIADKNAGVEKAGSNYKYSWHNVGFEQTDEHPVLLVSWSDAMAFCNWISRKEGRTYRLPTEAEWEFACRAGTRTRYYSGDDPETLAKIANVADAACKAMFTGWNWTIKASDGYVFTAPVGSFSPNAFGLYDMHGNARQWCSDFYAPEYYSKSPKDNPSGPEHGTYRVVRGSSWADSACAARAACRIWTADGTVNTLTGFRIAFDAEQENKGEEEKPPATGCDKVR